MAAGDVGELVRERRTSIGLTQRDLATASGISFAFGDRRQHSLLRGVLHSLGGAEVPARLLPVPLAERVNRLQQCLGYPPIA